MSTLGRMLMVGFALVVVVADLARSQDVENDDQTEADAIDSVIDQAIELERLLTQAPPDLSTGRVDWSRVPFSNVPPLDKGYGSALDPTLVGPRYYNARALFSYWLFGGGIEEPARWRAVDDRRTYGFHSDAFGLYTSGSVGRSAVSTNGFLTFAPYGTIRDDHFTRSSGLFDTQWDLVGTDAFTTYYQRYAYSRSRSTYRGLPLVERPRLIDPNLVVEQPQPEIPEPEDPALVAIREGALNRAAAVLLLRDRDRDPDRAGRDALRDAAVLYAIDGQIDRAARHLMTALGADPELRDRGPDREALELAYNDLLSAQGRAAREAKRSGDPAMWALAATLADARTSPTASRLWARFDEATATE